MAVGSSEGGEFDEIISALLRFKKRVLNHEVHRDDSRGGLLLAAVSIVGHAKLKFQ